MGRLLLLSEPYGYMAYSGTHISIRGAPLPARDRGIMAGVLSGYGCPPPVQTRALACLVHSGRYDCVVVTRLLLPLGAELKDLGYDLIVTKTPNGPAPLKVTQRSGEQTSRPEG